MFTQVESDGLRDMSFSGLFGRLADQLSRLIRQEFKLIASEMTESAKRAGRAIAFFAIAAVLGLAAFVGLTCAAVAALAIVMPVWGAALVVTVSYLVLALICVKVGITALQRISAQRNPIASLEEDLKWVTMRAKSAKP